MKTTVTANEIEGHIRDRYRGAVLLSRVTISPEQNADANWTASPDPALMGNDDKRNFIAAVFQVQRLHNLLTD